MTSTVSIHAPAGHKVEVTEVHLRKDGSVSEEQVVMLENDQSKVVYIHKYCEVRVREVHEYTSPDTPQ